MGKNTAKRRKQVKNSNRIKARKKGSDKYKQEMILHKVSSFNDARILNSISSRIEMF